MHTIKQAQLAKLRGLVARALDSAASPNEANSSALAACRLLATEGFGVGSPDLAGAVIVSGCDAAGCGEMPPDHVLRAAVQAMGGNACDECGNPLTIHVSGCSKSARRTRGPIAGWDDLAFGSR